MLSIPDASGLVNMLYTSIVNYETIHGFFSAGAQQSYWTAMTLTSTDGRKVMKTTLRKCWSSCHMIAMKTSMDARRVEKSNG